MTRDSTAPQGPVGPGGPCGSRRSAGFPSESRGSDGWRSNRNPSACRCFHITYRVSVAGSGSLAFPAPSLAIHVTVSPSRSSLVPAPCPSRDGVGRPSWRSAVAAVWSVPPWSCSRRSSSPGSALTPCRRHIHARPLPGAMLLSVSRLPTVISRSTLAVSHRLGGLLRAWTSGTSRPEAGPGFAGGPDRVAFHRFSGWSACSRLLTRRGTVHAEWLSPCQLGLGLQRTFGGTSSVVWNRSSRLPHFTLQGPCHPMHAAPTRPAARRRPCCGKGLCGGG